jgi:hypothetical protein
MFRPLLAPVRITFHSCSLISVQELRGQALFDAATPEFHAELMTAAGKLAVVFLTRQDLAMIAQSIAFLLLNPGRS